MSQLFDSIEMRSYFQHWTNMGIKHRLMLLISLLQFFWFDFFLRKWFARFSEVRYSKCKFRHFTTIFSKLFLVRGIFLQSNSSLKIKVSHFVFSFSKILLHFERTDMQIQQKYEKILKTDKIWLFKEFKACKISFFKIFLLFSAFMHLKVIHDKFNEN